MLQTLPLAASPAMATTAKLRWHVSALSMCGEINYNVCINEFSVESVCLARSYLEEILPTARAIREKLPAKYGTKKPQSYRKYWAIDIIRSQNYSKSSFICYTPRRSFISLHTRSRARPHIHISHTKWHQEMLRTYPSKLASKDCQKPYCSTTVKTEPALYCWKVFFFFIYKCGCLGQFARNSTNFMGFEINYHGSF